MEASQTTLVLILASGSLETWQHTELKHNYAAKEAIADTQLHIEQSYGVCYSVLLNLPYFDVICHHVVDPMHALFLGIAKHTVKVWRDLDIITSDHLSIIQEKVDNMTPPPKVP